MTSSALVRAYISLIMRAGDAARSGSATNIACLEQLLKALVASISAIVCGLSEPRRFASIWASWTMEPIVEGIPFANCSGIK